MLLLPWLCFDFCADDKLAAKHEQQALACSMTMVTFPLLSFNSRPCRDQWLCPPQDRGADEDEEQWALSRFVPVVQELVEDLAAGTLSPDDYPPVRAPNGRAAGAPCVRQQEHGWQGHGWNDWVRGRVQQHSTRAQHAHSSSWVTELFLTHPQ